MSPFLSFVRRLKPLDLLLPIGAALVTAGLQNLADREQAQRGRLADLANLAGDHLDALAAAGVVVPDELGNPDVHPLDPGVPWLAQHATSEPDEQETPPANRGWKLAALVLAAGTAVTLMNRDKLQGIVGALREGLQAPAPSPFGMTMPWPPAAAETPDEPEGPAPEWTGGRCTTCEQPAAWFVDEQEWWHVAITGLPMRAGHAVTHLPPTNAGWVKSGLTPTGDECGWPNCGYTPPEDLPAEDQVLALAVHRQQCIYRPAGAHVPGE